MINAMSIEVVFTAESTATGGGRDGHVKSSDGRIDLDTRPPKEAGGSGEGTNPEQLFSAGYAACFLGALDLPGDWVAAARRAGQVAVVLGPCTAHWDIAPVPGGLLEQLDELIAEGPDSGGGCGCSALSAEQVAELVDAGAFVVGGVRITAGNE